MKYLRVHTLGWLYQFTCMAVRVSNKKKFCCNVYDSKTV